GDGVEGWVKRKAGRSGGRADNFEGGDFEDIAAPEQDAGWTEEFQAHLLQTALDRIRPHFEDHTWQAFQAVWLEDRPAAEVAQALCQKLDWGYMAKSRVLKRLREEVQVLAEDSAWLIR